MAEYITEHIERSTDVDPDDKDRYIGLAVAENKLMWDILETQLNAVRQVPERAVGYDNMIGSEQFRTAVASFASDRVWNCQVNADAVVTMAGAGSILETLFYVLADPGEGILVPTPSYTGFWADIETRDELTVIPVHTSPIDGFTLTTELLQSAYDAAKVPIRALLLTNPTNPTGQIWPEAEIIDAVEWARSVGIHIVMNEIYALSTHGQTPFVSAATIFDRWEDDLHLVWAFSKDFAMSGLRCGVITTTNEQVRGAISELAYWSAVSGDTQHLLHTMLEDTVWIDKYLSKLRSRLGESYSQVTTALTEADIPFYPADAGLFVLCDLREFLPEQTWAAEHTLWRRMVDEVNVNLTPGSACRISEPGFFRVCFAQEPADIAVAAIRRIAEVSRVRDGSDDDPEGPHVRQDDPTAL